MYFITIIFLAILIANLDSYEWYPYSKHRYCSNKPGSQCLSRNSFIYCPDSWFYLREEQKPLWCPEGYICNDQTNYPCIKDPEKAFNNHISKLDCSSNQNLPVFPSVSSFDCANHQGVKCLSKTAFIYCSHKWQFFVARYDALNCPQKYICQENLVTPCIQDPEWSSIECLKTTILENQSSTSNTLPSDVTVSEFTTETTTSVDSTTNTQQVTFTNNIFTTFERLPSVDNDEATETSTMATKFVEFVSNQDYIESTSYSPTIFEYDLMSTIEISDEILNGDTTVTTETTLNLSDQPISTKTNTEATTSTKQENTTNSETISNNRSNTQIVLPFVETLNNEENFAQIFDQKIQTTSKAELSSTTNNSNLFEQILSGDVFLVNDSTSLTTVNAKMSTTSAVSNRLSSLQSTVASDTNSNSFQPTSLSIDSNSQKLTSKDAAGLLSTPRNTNPLPPKYSTPPSCSSEGVVYAAANCRQYYLCQKFLFFWVTSYLKTCDEGMGFRSIEMKCVPLPTSDCQIR